MELLDPVLPLHIWKRFVKEGTLDTSRINKKITESWYRCKQAQVSPFLEEANHVITGEQFSKQKEKHAMLLELANPHLNRMQDSIYSLGMIALVIDPEGYVLSINGNKEVIHKANQINFVEGVRWTEGEVGTNAIGTALQIHEPVMVSGSEHYSIASHQWSCSASPIRNDDGELIGIIDVSCPVERSHPYMLGMVTSVAYAIEREWSIRVHKDEMELIQKSIDLIDSDRPIVICNHKQEIVFASKPIRKNFPKLYGLRLTELSDYGLIEKMNRPVYSEYNRGYVIGRAVFLEYSANKSNQFYLMGMKQEDFYFEGEIGRSLTFKKTIEEIKLVSKSDATVYILGETGTGKEVIAHSIHQNSKRRKEPFVAVNCGAIPKELIASELFGYVEGAFTGASRQGYKGKFEQANGGTIFLDEIGEIPSSMQVSLLRVLQEKKVTPIGSTKEIKLDVRVITATHRDLKELVNEGEFREDLYFRLHVYPISVPPLRERKEDIPDIINFICQKNNWLFHLPEHIQSKLVEYDWPGNIRELINVLERMHILSQSEEMDFRHIENYLQANHESALNNDVRTSNEETGLTAREKVQRDLMIQALEKTKGNVTLAAKLLEIPRSTFYKRLRKYNL